MSALINKRIIVAAAKLALFYTALVTLEIVVLALSSGSRVELPTVQDIEPIALFLSMPFAFAFLLLAMAREWGFVAFWAMLGSAWIAIVSHSWQWPAQYPSAFFAWSIFALPLWIIGQAGIPRTSTRRTSGSIVLLVCWTVLLLGAQLYSNHPNSYHHPLRLDIADVLAWIWAPMPLILSAFAIRHVWRGTANRSLPNG